MRPTLSRAGGRMKPGEIKQLRKGLKESLRVFGDRLGVTPAAVFLWESGKSTPTPENMATLERLAAHPTPAPVRTADPVQRVDITPSSGGFYEVVVTTTSGKVSTYNAPLESISISGDRVQINVPKTLIETSSTGEKRRKR